MKMPSTGTHPPMKDNYDKLKGWIVETDVKGAKPKYIKTLN